LVASAVADVTGRTVGTTATITPQTYPHYGVIMNRESNRPTARFRIRGRVPDPSNLPKLETCKQRMATAPLPNSHPGFQPRTGSKVQHCHKAHECIAHYKALGRLIQMRRVRARYKLTAA
jgi:hypothetical protein